MKFNADERRRYSIVVELIDKNGDSIEATGYVCENEEDAKKYYPRAMVGMGSRQSGLSNAPPGSVRNSLT